MSDPDRLLARPHPLTEPGPGLRTLSLCGRRDSYLFLPESVKPARPAPLVLLLHGAGGHAHDGLRMIPPKIVQEAVARLVAGAHRGER